MGADINLCENIYEALYNNLYILYSEKLLLLKYFIFYGLDYKDTKEQLLIYFPELKDYIEQWDNFPSIFNAEELIQYKYHRIYSNRISEELMAAITNKQTLTGDELTSYDMDTLFFSKEDGHIWCFHQSELPSIIMTKTNPYNRYKYSEQELIDMIDSLNYFPYYSGHYEYHSRTKQKNSYYIEIISYFIGFYDTYLNIKNVLEIRNTLFKEMFAFFLGGKYLFLYNEYENKKKMLNSLCKISLYYLQNEIINISNLCAIFNQVIEDNHLCDSIVEVCGEEIFEEDITYDDLEDYLDEEQIDKVKKLVNNSYTTFNYLAEVIAED